MMFMITLSNYKGDWREVLEKKTTQTERKKQFVENFNSSLVEGVSIVGLINGTLVELKHMIWYYLQLFIENLDSVYL
ncbi:hypothetical protein P8452_15403 [Trifolium repens]|nr:hypothetical protein P8452_15403 [Trifolium repens]